MATQYVNQSTSNVTIDGQEVNFESNAVTAELFDIDSVTLLKAQDKALVVSGGTINYTITITNLSIGIISNFDFQDIIPTGMTYATGSFKVNGTAQTPTIAGQQLDYTFTTLPIGPTIVTFECNVT